jgi:hypothetical protein
VPGRIWRGSISIGIHPPLEAMLVAADAVRALLEADPQTSVREAVREAVGGLDALQEAVDCLGAYQQFQPEHMDRRAINAQLRTQVWHTGDGG